jgi:hypothetical protein
MLINTVTPSELLKVQTFDFQNDWALSWTGYSIGYWTPDYVTGQWWRIWTWTNAYQWWVKPPTSIFQWTLKKIKIYRYKPWAITSSIWWWVWICNTNESSMIEYWRNWSPRIMIYPWWTSIPVTDITGEITSEYILEDNWHITLKLNWTGYDVWSYASSFQTIWSNQELQLEMWEWWWTANHYIRKVEITTQP